MRVKILVTNAPEIPLLSLVLFLPGCRPSLIALGFGTDVRTRVKPVPSRWWQTFWRCFFVRLDVSRWVFNSGTITTGSPL